MVNGFSFLRNKGTNQRTFQSVIFTLTFLECICFTLLFFLTHFMLFYSLFFVILLYCKNIFKLHFTQKKIYINSAHLSEVLKLLHTCLLAKMKLFQ